MPAKIYMSFSKHSYIYIYIYIYIYRLSWYTYILVCHSSKAFGAVSVWFVVHCSQAFHVGRVLLHN
jgi:hypothetical protein